MKRIVLFAIALVTIAFADVNSVFDKVIKDSGFSTAEWLYLCENPAEPIPHTNNNAEMLRIMFVCTILASKAVDEINEDMAQGYKDDYTIDDFIFYIANHKGWSDRLINKLFEMGAGELLKEKPNK